MTQDGGRAVTGQNHDCRMAATYATVDCDNYCGHPSHDEAAVTEPPSRDYSAYWGADICGNCGIPVSRHGSECGEWADEVVVGADEDRRLQ